MSVDSDVLADTSPNEGSPSRESTDSTVYEEADDTGAATTKAEPTAKTHRLRIALKSWRRILAFGILPGLILMLTAGAGYLKWRDGVARESQSAAAQSVAAASESTVALLSYRPDTVERDLTAARDRLTGSFQDAYTELVHDVVIPGAKQKQVTAVATVPAAASVSASATHAVVLVFVNQTITVGNDAPSDTASSIRVTLQKVHDRWLISAFDPV